MKTQLLNLTIAAVCCLPLAGFAQGTYLSDPNDTNNHILVVAPSGNVGIGTALPSASLHVIGRIMAEGTGGAGSIAMKSTAIGGHQYEWYPDSPDAGDLTLYDRTLATRRLVVDSVGNVGIGLAHPKQKLDINGNAQVTGNFPYVAFSPNTWSDFAYIQANVTANLGANGDYLSLVAPRGKGFVFFQTQVGAKMVIDPTGNVGIGTPTPTVKLDVAGKVNCTVLELTSDRAQKSGFEPVDLRAILDQVSRLPITTWHYTNEPAVRHLGPVAQDFQTAFKVGSDDKHIATVDADGVLFAAIQALIQKLDEQLKEKDADIAALKNELHAFKANHADIAARFEKLEKLMAQAVPPAQLTASSALTAEAR